MMYMTIDFYAEHVQFHKKKPDTYPYWCIQDDVVVRVFEREVRSFEETEAVCTVE